MAKRRTRKFNSVSEMKAFIADLRKRTETATKRLIKINNELDKKYKAELADYERMYGKLDKS